MKINQRACQAEASPIPLPEMGMDACKMRGHWLLAKMGKKVLRPGGLELTRRMLAGLDIDASDEVVEFAPGLGVTARMTLARNPASYTAIEREGAAARRVRCYLRGENQACRLGLAQDTGLDDASASVVYGEAMLTMHPDGKKRRIMREAARILKPGGRYAIHEVGIVPDDADGIIKKQIRKELSSAIHIGASPATVSEWREMLQTEGFRVVTTMSEPFHLLEPVRVIRDEGFWGALRFAGNVLRHGDARRKVLRMKSVFRKYSGNLIGIVMIAVRQSPVGTSA
jgi:SAM-dependent methyltransferase